jgi:Mrp family chromosome partitioning ATPase
MSDVNQAFLRAYVKSRAAAGSQPLKTSQGDVQLRVDPAVTAPVQIASAPTPPAAVASAKAAPAAADSVKTAPAKTGVWSALGVERGIKAAVVSQPPPAIVRNATTAVPIESTQVRTRQAPAPTMVVQEKSPSLETLNQAWTKKRAPALSELRPQTAPHANEAPQRSAVPQNMASQPSPRTSHPTVAAKGPMFVSGGIGVNASQIGSTAPEMVHNTTTADAPGAGKFFAAPEFPIETDSAAPESQTRTDPPISNRVSGPHSNPSTQRGTNGSKRGAAGPPTGATSSQRAIDRESLQKLPLPVSFIPSWEVDSFLWPEVVLRLEQVDPSSFRQVGHHLANANQSGLKVLAVTSGERGVGRSTVAMHVARAAACAGLKIAIVDTDAANPSLVDQLRLDLEHGWQDCLFEAVPLEEVAVHAISDSVTLFPLTDAVSPQQVHANLHRMSKLIRRISTAFDLVILDSGRLHLDQRYLIGVSSERVVDAAVVVYDTELSIKEKIDSAISILQSLGLSSIGLVENFRS